MQHSSIKPAESLDHKAETAINNAAGIFHILVVDEDTTVRKRFAEALISESPASNITYQVITVGSAVAGQLAATRQRFHLAIVGIRPGAGGLDLIHLLKEFSPQIRLLLLIDQSVTSYQIELTRRLGGHVVDRRLSEEQMRLTVATILGLQQPTTPAKPPQQRPMLSVSPTQHTALRACLAQVGQQGGVNCLLLADLSGQDIASWNALGQIDVASAAALAAGDLLATIEINRVLNGKNGCKLILQEHEEQNILMGRVGDGLLLLMAVAPDIPLGWARLAHKRTSERVLDIIGTAPMEDQGTAPSEDFFTQIAEQIEQMR